MDRHYIGSVTATTHQEKGIITLESNPSRGTVLPAPHGKGNKCDKNVKYRKFLYLDLHILTSFLTSPYFSMGLTKEHCTEIVKLNYLNNLPQRFYRTMNEILPELKGIYRKTIYGIARG